MLDAPVLSDAERRDSSVSPRSLLPGDLTPRVGDRKRPRWFSRAALRFCSCYFVGYVVTTQMLQGLLQLPGVSVPNLGALPPVKNVVESTAATVFGAQLPLIVRSGSGDKTYDWVHAGLLLVFAVGLTVILTWRSRGNDVRLYQRMHLFVRFALGSTLVTYGVVKAIPLQMPSPSLNRLLERFGDFSPMGVLWASIGASPAYEMFTGCVELLAGVLLFIPHTATLGALTALAATVQVFTLNMTYDVPVKLFSFHLVLMSIFLLAADARRLLNVLVLNRPAEPSTRPWFGNTRRAMRTAVLAQIVFGTYLVGVGLFEAAQSWNQFGGGAPRSALYGIWDIDVMKIDGHERAPLISDFDRWRRVTFDRPTSISFHRMDDTVVNYTAQIDEAARTIILTKPQDPTWKSTFTYDRSAPDRLTLAGELDGRALDMRLKGLDVQKLLLVSRGFHWIQEYPFNR